MHGIQQAAPGTPIHIAEWQAQAADHVCIQVLGVEHLGDVIDGRCIGAGNHGFFIHVAHATDLVLHGLRHIPVRAQDQRIRDDADAAQGSHGVLGGLGFQLAGWGQVRHQGNVDEQHAIPAHLLADLTGCLHEGLGFDVAHGAANFGDHHVRGVTVAIRQGHG